MENKSEIYYFDDNDKMVDKEKATKAIIRELDENGNLVREIFGVINHDELEKDEELEAMINYLGSEKQTKEK